jgi:hypothetical protein
MPLVTLGISSRVTSVIIESTKPSSVPSCVSSSYSSRHTSNGVDGISRFVSTHQEGEIGQERLYHYVCEACFLHGCAEFFYGLGLRLRRNGQLPEEEECCIARSTPICI